MVDKLKNRSVVDKVVVSNCSTSCQPLDQRDLQETVELEGTDGSTKGNIQCMVKSNLN